MKDTKRRKVLALRFTDKEYAELNHYIQIIYERTGITVSKAWVVRKMMEIGKEKFQLLYPDPDKQWDDIFCAVSG